MAKTHKENVGTGAIEGADELNIVPPIKNLKGWELRVTRNSTIYFHSHSLNLAKTDHNSDYLKMLYNRYEEAKNYITPPINYRN